ncbi:unnamed protein product [Heligmosomoides polygyrus]|uniref:Myeloid zinc finger 1 n=1 Tax=Heligmosomoides polygyrus TaxID=6339 RepID=A0A183F420_HELPZ|nr:unnamed protein product [Heligmosomoides polygyrus]
MALLVLLDHQDLLEALEPMAVPDRLDTAHPMDHLDLKDHPDLMELLVLLEDPDKRDSPPCPLLQLPESPGHKDHLDLEDLPEAMGSLETVAAKEHQDLKDHQGATVNPVLTATLDKPEVPVSQAEVASPVSVRNTAPSTVASSSRMELDVSLELGHCRSNKTVTKVELRRAKH